MSYCDIFDNFINMRYYDWKYRISRWHISLSNRLSSSMTHTFCKENMIDQIRSMRNWNLSDFILDFNFFFFWWLVCLNFAPRAWAFTGSQLKTKFLPDFFPQQGAGVVRPLAPVVDFQQWKMTKKKKKTNKQQPTNKLNFLLFAFNNHFLFNIQLLNLWSTQRLEISKWLQESCTEWFYSFSAVSFAQALTLKIFYSPVYVYQ